MVPFASMREGLPSRIFGLQTGRCRSLSFPEDEHEGNNMFKRNPPNNWCGGFVVVFLHGR